MDAFLKRVIKVRNREMEEARRAALERERKMPTATPDQRKKAADELRARGYGWILGEDSHGR